LSELASQSSSADAEPIDISERIWIRTASHLKKAVGDELTSASKHAVLDIVNNQTDYGDAAVCVN
jgi:hypothetical protein